ncbi:putative Cation proton exchanger [Tripterygium wilfordii]|uniref:Putative Cation proton exchanger n=1 Tax=Tripterygium wilfordii TaxID=458696 RepID=A0A7J7DRF9_TRIWF|nr:cation/H(+) antiporter 4-like isoform X1 [Tripterygium wilfordii]KAF5748869.1 putative Cation proton exchanger [Tripterygium wilfordii]
MLCVSQAGIVIGSTVLEHLMPELHAALFPPESDQLFKGLTRFGFLIFVFMAGVRMDVNLVIKLGTKAWIIGIVTLIVPFLYIQHPMFEVFYQFKDNENEKVSYTVQQEIDNSRLYLLTLLSTQFPGVGWLLMHLKMSNTQMGHLALASALISELTRLSYLTLIVFMSEAVEFAPRIVLKSAFLCFFIIVLIVRVLRPLMLWVIRRTPEGKQVKEIYIAFIVAAVLFLALIGDGVGINFLFWPFVLGLAVPTGPPLASTLEEKFDTFVTGLLIPLLATYCGIKTDIPYMLSHYEASRVLLDFSAVVGILLKIVLLFVTALFCRMSVQEAAAFSLILNVKGIPELGLFASFTYDEVSFKTLSSAVVITFTVVAIVSILVRKLYDPSKRYTGYKNRSIMLTPSEGALQILACAYRQEDAVAAIKLLEVSNPSKESPLGVYGLYLEELVGSANPQLINHQLGQKHRTSSHHGLRSQQIIDIFHYFKSQHKKTAQVNFFTALSLPKLMHEDICWVAFDKAVSLIILPFHKKWNTKGDLVSDSQDLRALNINVLDKAPCSVGILLDRRRTRGLSSMFVCSSSFHVAVLFLDGEDDREALAYGIRMAGCPNVLLTILHFKTAQESGQENWRRMIENESLRTIKHELTKSEKVKYQEVIVGDGSKTASIVPSLQYDYDLIMVGRRHDLDSLIISGLSDWNESEELGPLGDLLASSEITAPASVLVVQQQILTASHSSTLNN